MFVRIAIITALAFALMAGIKNGSVLRITGFKGSCSVAYAATDGTELRACRSGRLAGYPNLSRDGCTQVGGQGKAEYWSCPATLVESQVGR